MYLKNTDCGCGAKTGDNLEEEGRHEEDFCKKARRINGLDSALYQRRHSRVAGEENAESKEKPGLKILPGRNITFRQDIEL